MDIIPIIGGVFTAAVATAVVVLNIRGAKPKCTHPWTREPGCRVIGADEDQYKLLCRCWEAWRGLGSGGSDLVFSGGPPGAAGGEVVLSVGRDDDFASPDVWATSILPNSDHETEWAVCKFDPAHLAGDRGWQIVMHELGHAFGFRKHTSKTGHVMSSHGRLGDDTTGLREALDDSIPRSWERPRFV